MPTDLTEVSALTETWLSQAAYDRLKAELDELRSSGRERASRAIEVARSHGDLRENAEYEAAKEEQGKMEARIRRLEEMLHRAKVGDAPTGEGGVQPGMVVSTVDGDGDESTFLLGSREDRVPGIGVVSAQSPLGRALVGHQVGETVTYEAPGGAFSVRITDLQPLRS